MTQREKLEQARKEAFPTSEAFSVAPEDARLGSPNEQQSARPCSGPIDRSS